MKDIREKREVEVDPNGLSSSDAGAKLDAGKPMPRLIVGGFSKALMKVAEVGTFGAKKYTEEGWRKVPNGVKRYEDAMLRHYLYEKGGEKFDSESDLLHAAHLAWNALARLELMLDEKS